MIVLHYVYLYLLTVPVFFVVDMLWLGVIAKNFYQRELAAFLGPVNWPAAIIFYLIFIGGIILFAVIPGIEARSLAKTALLGALFGFIAYATYDLTNLATLRAWPLSVTIVDMFWGAVLSSVVASISWFLASRLFF